MKSALKDRSSVTSLLRAAGSIEVTVPSTTATLCSRSSPHPVRRFRARIYSLLASSRRCRVRICAEYASFDQKDVLKRRGYRWDPGDDGRPKAWWTEVDEEDVASELRFLETEVYLRDVALRKDVIPPTIAIGWRRHVVDPLEFIPSPTPPPPLDSPT